MSSKSLSAKQCDKDVVTLMDSKKQQFSQGAGALKPRDFERVAPRVDDVLLSLKADLLTPTRSPGPSHRRAVDADAGIYGPIASRNSAAMMARPISPGASVSRRKSDGASGSFWDSAVVCGNIRSELGVDGRACVDDMRRGDSPGARLRRFEEAAVDQARLADDCARRNLSWYGESPNTRFRRLEADECWERRIVDGRARMEQPPRKESPSFRFRSLEPAAAMEGRVDERMQSSEDPQFNESPVARRQRFEAAMMPEDCVEDRVRREESLRASSPGPLFRHRDVAAAAGARYGDLFEKAGPQRRSTSAGPSLAAVCTERAERAERAEPEEREEQARRAGWRREAQEFFTRDSVLRQEQQRAQDCRLAFEGALRGAPSEEKEAGTRLTRQASPGPGIHMPYARELEALRACEEASVQQSTRPSVLNDYARSFESLRVRASGELTQEEKREYSTRASLLRSTTPPSGSVLRAELDTGVCSAPAVPRDHAGSAMEALRRTIPGGALREQDCERPRETRSLRSSPAGHSALWGPASSPAMSQPQPRALFAA